MIELLASYLRVQTGWTAFERAGFSERISVFPALTFGLLMLQSFLPFLLGFVGSAAFGKDGCLVFSGFSGHLPYSLFRLERMAEDSLHLPDGLLGFAERLSIGTRRMTGKKL